MLRNARLIRMLLEIRSLLYIRPKPIWESWWRSSKFTIRTKQSSSVKEMVPLFWNPASITYTLPCIDDTNADGIFNTGLSRPNTVSFTSAHREANIAITSMTLGLIFVYLKKIKKFFWKADEIFRYYWNQDRTWNWQSDVSTVSFKMFELGIWGGRKPLE